MRDAFFTIGIDIGSDHPTVLAVDAAGSMRARVHHEKRRILPDELIESETSATALAERGFWLGAESLSFFYVVINACFRLLGDRHC